MTIRLTPSAGSATSIGPRGPGASRARISSIDRACSSCWRVVLVGSHMASRPAAIAASASAGRNHSWAATSSPSNVASAPGGRLAAKNLASNRRGIDGGVTQRDNGTSQSVRSDRSRSSASSASVVSPPTSAERAARIRASRPGSGPPTSASSTPASSNSSRIAATWAACAGSGARSPPSAAAASTGEMADRTMSVAALSAGSTRPPGKTWTPGANAIVAGRCVRSASSPAGPSRSSTTVAAGLGSTGPFVTRPQPSAIAAASSSRSARGSVTGRRHARPRQT